MLEAVEKPLVSENAQPTADAMITDLSTTATVTSAAQSPLHQPNPFRAMAAVASRV